MLFYCGNQWGYTPVGKLLNIPAGFCNPPTGLTSVVYAQYVTLSWQAPHDYLKFVLEYKLLAAPTWTAVDVFGQSYVLTLAGATVYQWRVKTVCADAPLRESTYTASSFVTGPAVTGCTPVGSLLVQYQNTKYYLSWTPTGAQYYNVEVKVKGSSAVRKYTTQDSWLYLTDLTPGTTYEARVTAVCQDMTMTPVPSPWVEWIAANLTCPKPGPINYTKSTGSIVMGWGSAGPGYTYDIYLGVVPVVLNYPNTSFTLTGLLPNTSYNVKVFTNCGNGVSEAQQITVTTDANACGQPSALVASALTPTGFTVTWVPAGSVDSQQLILNNGAPIPLATGVSTYTFTNLPSGSNNVVTVRSVCPTNVSADITISVQLTGCAAVTGLVLTPSSNSIEANWNPVANAIKYRVLATKVSDSSTAYSGTVFSTFAVFPLLQPLTDYIISVTTECAAGALGTPTTGNATTTALSNCVNAIIDTQLVASTTIDILTWHFADGRTTGFFEYRLIRVSDSAQVASGQISSILPISFSGLTPATAYKVFIFDRGSSGNLACTPTEVATITTTVACLPPSNVTAVLQTGDTQILVNATASPSAPPSYEIEYLLSGTTAWINVGFHALPYTITPVAPGKYKVRLRSNCPASVSGWVESGFACPTPAMPTSSPIPNGIHLSWPALAGITTYVVNLVAQMTGTVKTYTVTTNSIDISDLVASSTYSGYVKAICDEAAGTGMDSPAFSFVSGAEPPGNVITCADPEFTAYAQDCEITDPGGEGGGNGGGGGEVGAGCAVTAADWTLVNAIFAAAVDDAPNDTFLEATFEIAQSIPIGSTAAMPGGIMGNISAECLPVSTVNVALEVIVGGALQVGNGTYATNGNITVAGSYLSDGSNRLIVRLRGNYKKV
jgi:hypothetical protein